MTQLDLFQPSQPPRPWHVGARVRREDPATSREAAALTERSGSADSQRELVLEYVRSHPGRTSAEIAQALGLDRYTPSRRLPELRAAGLVVSGEPRICQVRGTRAMVWHAATRDSPA